MHGIAFCMGKESVEKLVELAKILNLPIDYRTEEELRDLIASAAGYDVDLMSTQKQRDILDDLSASLNEDLTQSDRLIRENASNKI